ncbi:MAG: hypothetical protein V8S96_10305 [Lachnospiraceae bacterium]
MNESERVKRQETIDKPVFLRDTVKELFRKMLAPLKMPLAIFDAEEKLVYKSKEYPEYCRSICRIDENLENCALIREKAVWVPPYYEGASACVCEHGLWVYTLPLFQKENSWELSVPVMYGRRSSGRQRRTKIFPIMCRPVRYAASFRSSTSWRKQSAITMSCAACR